MAIAAKNDGDARILIMRKIELAERTPELQKAYDAAKANAEKIRKLREELTSTLKQRQDEAELVAAKYEKIAKDEALNQAVDKELSKLKQDLGL